MTATAAITANLIGPSDLMTFPNPVVSAVGERSGIWLSAVNSAMPAPFLAVMTLVTLC